LNHPRIVHLCNVKEVSPSKRLNSKVLIYLFYLFLSWFHNSTLEDKEKMAEFDLHNMALIDMNVWDPNAKLGDLQLMAIASWMNHEELRAEEIKRLIIKEQNEPLMIRVEPLDPMALINTHNLLANDPQIAPRYLTN